MTKKLCLFGLPRCGKTSYIYGLNKIMEKGRYSKRSEYDPSLGYKAMPSTHSTIVYREWLRDYFEAKKKFPPETPPGEEEPCYWTIIKEGILFKKSYELHIHDVAGEDFRRYFEPRRSEVDTPDIIPETARNFSHILKNYSALLLLLDPNPRLLEASLKFIQVLILELCKERNEKKVGLPISVVLTKNDIYNIHDAKAYLRKFQPQLLTSFEVRVENYKFFVCEAVGKCIKGKDHMVYRPPNVIEPKGVIEPLDWLLNQM